MLVQISVVYTETQQKYNINNRQTNSSDSDEVEQLYEDVYFWNIFC